MITLSTKRLRVIRHLAVLVAVSLWAFSSDLLSADFDQAIRPIFETHCVTCHGADKQKGGVGFDLKRRAFAISDSGHTVIDPGHADKSLLMKMITHKDPKERMPRDKPALSDETIAMLAEWINAGAVWPDDNEEIHWAYTPLAVAPRATVELEGWPKNAIDYYTLAQLEAKGFSPQPQADPETLLRRVYLDVVGLPPELEVIDAFLDDPSAAAYEAVIDRLMASPQYGENWARHWLDLARAADSDGYQRDGFRAVWPYRDYVINAFNADMPYDTFVIEQLAGDLLPNPTEQQKIATVFNRNPTHNREAGTDIDEDRHKQVVDRVNTFGIAFLGSSLACAQCHNHKYDPFTIKEYYEIFAFFNNTPIESRTGGRDSTIYTTGPMLPIAVPVSEEARAKRSKLEGAFIEAVQGLSTNAPLEDLDMEAAVELYEGTLKKPKPLRKQLREIEVIKLSEDVPVMREMEIPRVSTLFQRGNWTTPGAEVAPAVPAFLNRFPAGAPANRLGLALWVTSRDNPLIARAAVNRYWAEIFGQGIVVSVEDLGKQGTLPSHPALLDYLAVTFMKNGWSTKGVIKEILMSATYQQGSVVSRELAVKDPKNDWLTRGPRFRLSAEATRDSILSFSGLLSSKIGGPSVMPPQPTKIWRVTGNVDNTYRTSGGEDRYRRGVYTIWRRHAHYPSFANFDAPNRGACSVKRTRSNTPLQALTLMNDSVYVGAAKAFGKRLQERAGDDPDGALRDGFRMASSRRPSVEEMGVLKSALNENSGSEYDGWFSVATILINMSSTITKD